MTEKKHPKKQKIFSQSTPLLEQLIASGVASRKMKLHLLLLVAGIIALVFIAYLPSLQNGFTNWDDQVYVTESALIKNFSFKLLSKPVAANYHPITMISLAVNYHFSGLNPFSYHLTNLLFHLANTTLVFFFVLTLSGRNVLVATISSLLFGIHPMHVESVAWIAARKDVLFCFFFMSALLVYLKFKGGRKLAYYSLALLFFVLSLLSKSQAVVLPAIFVLIDYLLKKPLTTKSLIEKIPFFALSLLFGIITLQTQKEFGAIGLVVYTFSQKICFASYSLLVYTGKLFVPINLSAFYPYPSVQNGLSFLFKIAPLIIVILTIATIWLKRNRTVIFGLLFFLVSLSLVLQLISVGNAIMADRYTYLPYVGIFILVGIAFQQILDKLNSRIQPLKPVLWIMGAGYIILLTGTTYQRNKVWKNSETLWTDVIEKFPAHSTGYYNRGQHYDKTNQFDKAITDYTQAINLKPDYYEANFNRGRLYFLHKKAYQKAIDDFTRALDASPENAGAWLALGDVNYEMNNLDKAISNYTRAIQYNPKNEVAYVNRGSAYFSKKAFAEALAEYSKAIELKPDYADAYHNRSVVYGNLNDKVNAIRDEEKALQLGRKKDEVYMKWLQE